MQAVSNALLKANTQDASTTDTAATTKTQDPLTSKDTFLKLLVAQIKNQNPLSPTDPTQFLGQLTQYSELEQLVNIDTDIQNLSKSNTGGTATPTTTGAQTANTKAI